MRGICLVLERKVLFGVEYTIIQTVKVNAYGVPIHNTLEQYETPERLFKVLL